MEELLDRGFRERAHTADWALDVWAPDLSGLLEQAARGMYTLMEVELKPGAPVGRSLHLEAAEAEGLLVAFLAELLYLAEHDGLAFDQFDLRLHGLALEAQLRGAALGSQSKEIKAVTYHQLEIRREDGRIACTVVFDV